MKHKITVKEKTYYEWLKIELMDLVRLHKEALQKDIELIFESPLSLEEVLKLRTKTEEEIDAIAKDASDKRYSRTPKDKREQYGWERREPV